MSCGITHRFAAVRLLVLAALWLCWSGSSLAQTYKTIYLFGGGGGPRGTLVEGTDGNLYGTTYGKGGRNNGMIFKITPGGTFTTLHAGGGNIPNGANAGNRRELLRNERRRRDQRRWLRLQNHSKWHAHDAVQFWSGTPTATYRNGLSRPAMGTSMGRPCKVERTVAGCSSESPQAAC